MFRVLLPATLFLLLPHASDAQYLYLDTNGDGINTAADRLNANGTPTTVDAYINTNHNKGGALATCDTGDGDLGFWNSYAVNLGTPLGTVSFSNFVNQQANFNLSCVGVGIDFTSTSTEMTACRATATSEAGGLRRMFTVTVTGLTGTPSLQYLALGNLSPNFTSFGTPCSANDFDNTYKLGSDFFDRGGAGPFGTANGPPQINAPANVNGAEGSLVTVTGSASDPDATDLVTLTQTNNAPFLTGPASAGPAANPSIILSGTPSFTQAGSYAVNWTARDNLATPNTSTATTNVSIANTNRSPVVTAPATASGNENTLITFMVTASDADGEAIYSLGGNPLPGGSSFTRNATKTSGTFNWTPSFTQAGSYNVTWTATAPIGGSGTAATAITVNNDSSVDQAPVVTAPVTASFTSNMASTVTVSATDPDGQAITSLTAASSPATTGSTFTPNGTNTSGTFSWTPTLAQAGTYAVTFTATNALSGSAVTTVTVRETDGAPIVTAPAIASGNENTVITLTVTASDPDADAILSLNGAPLPGGSTFTPNATRTSGTFNWTPNFTQAGSYDVTWTATNALSGTVATAITVNNVDRAPIVTAPATANFTRDIASTVTVSATDPDGQAITSLTAVSSPATTGSTFTPNDTNTSGTFSWTPTLAQAGIYAVTFTATNALSGSAVTTVMVGGTNIVGNPSFETSTVGWSGHSGGTIQRVEGGHDGAYSLEVRGPTGSTETFSVNDTPNWVTRAPTAGSVYRYTAWVRSAATAGKARLRIRQYLWQGTVRSLLGSWPSSSVRLGPTWQKVTVDVPVVVAGATLDFRAIDSPIAAGESFQIDDISITIFGGSAVSSGMEAVMSPNPLNPEAVLAFTTTEAGPVHVHIFSVSGRHVRTLSETATSPGRQAIRFNGMDSSGRRLASGIYFYKIEAGSSRTTGRFAIMK